MPTFSGAKKLAAPVSLALVLAACGSSSPSIAHLKSPANSHRPSSPSSSGGPSFSSSSGSGSGGGGSSTVVLGAGAHKALKYAQCMRTHGVPNFPDPTADGSFSLTGINPRSPAFQTAQKACSKLLPGGGPQSHPASEEEIRTATATAKCMRRHGVSGFPDPIVSQESPSSLNPANYSSISAGGGIIIAIPKSIDPASPAFEEAARACQFER